MRQLTAEMAASFDRRLNEARVPQAQHSSYENWAGLYMEFCQKLGYAPTAPTAMGPFLTDLAARGYSIAERQHARRAVRLLVCPDPQDPKLYLDRKSTRLNSSHT